MLDLIVRKIDAAPSKGKTKLVAIDGRGGSGKSSLARELIAHAPAFKLLSVDAFPCTPQQHPWHPLGTQTWVDWERLRDEALLPLSRGADATYLRTPWWKAQTPGPTETILSGGTVIVEGCYALRRELRDLYALRIWVECPVNEAMENAIRRDGEASRRSWVEAYVPNESAYIAAQHPDRAADIVVRSSSRNYELIRDS